jgi:formylglycine-generating enzyme required for sulfatase activity
MSSSLSGVRPVGSDPTGREKHPVTRVSWYEAAAYAVWLNASLPTEAQWK